MEFNFILLRRLHSAYANGHRLVVKVQNTTQQKNIYLKYIFIKLLWMYSAQVKLPLLSGSESTLNCRAPMQMYTVRHQHMYRKRTSPTVRVSQEE